MRDKARPLTAPQSSTVSPRANPAPAKETRYALKPSRINNARILTGSMSV